MLHVTGSHPFLVQALSSALIDSLNSRKRDQIVIEDVARTIDAVFKNWGNTYFRDLWDRTDPAQRVCLSTLKQQESCDLLALEQLSGLDRQTAYQVAELLVDRDLVRVDERGTYQLAAPLFSRWIERMEAVATRSSRRLSGRSE